MIRRQRVAGLLGIALGMTLWLSLAAVDAGAQTTTTEPPASTSSTTTTIVADPPPAPVEHSDPLGDPQATAWLARLVAFALGVVVAR